MKAYRMMLILMLCCLLPVWTAAEAPAPLTAADFVFALEDQPYLLGDPADGLLSAAEEAIGPLSMTAADSCMFTGQDKEYVNDELLIATYPIGPGGTDVVETVYVVGGTHATARGIGLGMTRDAVITAYGDGYTLDYDQMLYAQGDPLTEPILVFVLSLETDTVSAFYLMRNTSA